MWYNIYITYILLYLPLYGLGLKKQPRARNPTKAEISAFSASGWKEHLHEDACVIMCVYNIYICIIIYTYDYICIFYLLLWPLSVLGAIATQDLFVES